MNNRDSAKTSASTNNTMNRGIKDLRTAVSQEKGRWKLTPAWYLGPPGEIKRGGGQLASQRGWILEPEDASTS